MKIGVIADDHTGASDIGLALSDGGIRTALYLGCPAPDFRSDTDAGVVALKSRTAPADQAVADALCACDWLQSQGAEMIVFKICSTFDSTEAGNIGPVLDALADRLGEGPVVVCPAFPANGRTVYQGYLFVEDRLLNETGMADHPLTPMRDANIPRLLAAQTQKPVRRFGLGEAPGPEAAYWVADAITDEDLIRLGPLTQEHRLICGGSGIALGLPLRFGFAPGRMNQSTVQGPGAVLSGSCSAVTRAQIAQYSARFASRRIDVAEVLETAGLAEKTANWAMTCDAPLIYTSADPAEVAASQETFGADRVATAIERFFGALAVALVDRGATRIVVAGGETSGAVTTALGLAELRIGTAISAGVPMLTSADGRLALALKSGNFGGQNFFSDALAIMQGP